MKINKNVAIAIAAGTLTFAIYAWQAPEELHEAIPDAVIVTSTLVQMMDKKQDPPDDRDNDKDGTK